MTTSKIPTLQEFRKAILDALAEDSPYSWTILNLTLGLITDWYGRAETNRTVRELGLHELGFREFPIPEQETLKHELKTKKDIT